MLAPMLDTPCGQFIAQLHEATIPASHSHFNAAFRMAMVAQCSAEVKWTVSRPVRARTWTACSPHVPLARM